MARTAPRQPCPPEVAAPAVGETAGLSAHILPTSATMIGVCMTVLSIGRVGAGANWHMLIDKALAVDALIFLLSAFLSFAAMRATISGRRYERRAEAVFLFGLGLLVVVALSLAFTIR